MVNFERKPYAFENKNFDLEKIRKFGKEATPFTRGKGILTLPIAIKGDVDGFGFIRSTSDDEHLHKTHVLVAVSNRSKEVEVFELAIPVMNKFLNVRYSEEKATEAFENSALAQRGEPNVSYYIVSKKDLEKSILSPAIEGPAAQRIRKGRSGSGDLPPH